MILNHTWFKVNKVDLRTQVKDKRPKVRAQEDNRLFDKDNTGLLLFWTLEGLV